MRCKQLVTDGKPCGLDTGNSRDICDFHALFYVGPKERGVVENYLRTRKVGDLNGREFRGYTFDSGFADAASNIKGLLKFDFCKFRDCSFVNARLRSPVSFQSATFHNTAFEHISFTGQQADFTRSEFHGEGAPFQDCTIDCRSEVIFSYASFRSKVMPFPSVFIRSELVQFDEAKIEADRLPLLVRNEFLPPESTPTRYAQWLCIAARNILIGGLRFSGNFEYASSRLSDAAPPILHATRINFSQMKSATFTDAHLGKTYFLGSKIDDVNFADCQWRGDTARRRRLYDETDRPEGIAERKIRRLYIQLKRNYERVRDFELAGDWHYGEMDSRRRDSSKSERFVLTLYKYVNGYGESYLRPLAILGCVWVLSSLLYLANGFHIVRLSERSIDYQMCWFCGWNWDNFIGFGKALLFSAGAMALQVGRGFELGGIGSHITYIAQLLCTAILLPLFLLALRRRFKR